MLAFNLDCSVSLCDRVAQSCCHRVSVSDGILLYAQKYAKGVKGTPLKNPILRKRIMSAVLYFRHEGIEWANLLPRSPASAVRKSVSAFASECLVLQCLGGHHTCKARQRKATNFR